MKTIIQTIGPLYGEEFNGSVFGQPNGSITAKTGPYVGFYLTNSAYRFVFNKPTDGTIDCVNSSGLTGAITRYIAYVPAGTPYKVWLQLQDGNNNALLTQQETKWNDDRGSYWAIIKIQNPDAAVQIIAGNPYRWVVYITDDSETFEDATVYATASMEVTGR